MLQGQAQGSVVAQVVIDVDTDTVIGAYGSIGALQVVAPKQSYAFALNGESSATPRNGRQVVSSLRQFSASPRLFSSWTHDALQNDEIVAVSLINGAGVAAPGVAGDVLVITVLRATVPA